MMASQIAAEPATPTARLWVLARPVVMAKPAPRPKHVMTALPMRAEPATPSARLLVLHQPVVMARCVPRPKSVSPTRVNPVMVAVAAVLTTAVGQGVVSVAMVLSVMVSRCAMTGLQMRVVAATPTVVLLGVARPAVMEASVPSSRPATMASPMRAVAAT